MAAATTELSHDDGVCAWRWWISKLDDGVDERGLTVDLEARCLMPTAAKPYWGLAADGERGRMPQGKSYRWWKHFSVLPCCENWN
ncbi:hypothetical protein ACP4OV_025574 [Aristida adscensionis]